MINKTNIEATTNICPFNPGPPATALIPFAAFSTAAAPPANLKLL